MIDEAEIDANIYADGNGVYSYIVTGEYACTPVGPGAPVLSCQSTVYPTEVPSGTTPVGVILTHPLEGNGNMSEIIYGDDILIVNQIYNQQGIDAYYTVTASGRVLLYVPSLYDPTQANQCQATFVIQGPQNPAPCKPY